MPAVFRTDPRRHLQEEKILVSVDVDLDVQVDLDAFEWINVHVNVEEHVA